MASIAIRETIKKLMCRSKSTPIHVTDHFTPVHAAVLLLLTVVLTPVMLGPSDALAGGPTANLIANWTMTSWQSPYDDYDNGRCSLRVATGWQSFNQLPDEVLRFMRDTDFASCFPPAIPRDADGNNSQNWWSGHPILGGIYQQVNIGTQGLGKAYAAKAWMLSVYDTTDVPKDNLMWKEIGIDPYGGINPASPNIVWGERNGLDDHFVDIRTAARAMSSTITVFIRVDAPNHVKPLMHQAWADTVVLALAPTVRAVSPASSASPTFTVQWDNATSPAPNSELLYYDVQYRDGPSGEWVLWQSKVTATSAQFTGQAGHTYSFRARAWANYNPGAIKLYGYFAPEGDTQTTVGGYLLESFVGGNRDFPIANATVTVNGTPIGGLTDSRGRCTLLVPDPGSYTLSASASGFTSPPAIPFIIAKTSGSIPISVTLRPSGESIQDGDFEDPPKGEWQVTAGTPVVQGEIIRSGTKSLTLRDATAPGQSSIQQMVNLNSVFRPVLSLYAKTHFGNVGDRLEIRKNGDIIKTIALSADWAHYWVELSPNNSFSEFFTLSFHAIQNGNNRSEVYLDEISIGPSPGGPERFFLPFTPALSRPRSRTNQRSKNANTRARYSSG